MKGTTLFALMIVGILVFAGLCVGLAYHKYDNVTTTLSIDDGITVKIDGIEVKDGETITIDKDLGHFHVEVKSDSNEYIGYAGQWTSGPDHVTVKKTDDYIQHSGEFTIHFGHGNFKGGLRVAYAGSETHETITMKYNLGPGLKVTSNGVEVVDGQIVDYDGDATIVATTLDGQRHYIHHEYYWGNDYERGSDTGTELNTSSTFWLDNMADYAPASGEITVKIQ